VPGVAPKRKAWHDQRKKQTKNANFKYHGKVGYLYPHMEQQNLFGRSFSRIILSWLQFGFDTSIVPMRCSNNNNK